MHWVLQSAPYEHSAPGFEARIRQAACDMDCAFIHLLAVVAAMNDQRRTCDPRKPLAMGYTANRWLRDEIPNEPEIDLLLSSWT
jgi:hypothetical protein